MALHLPPQGAWEARARFWELKLPTRCAKKQFWRMNTGNISPVLAGGSAGSLFLQEGGLNEIEEVNTMLAANKTAGGA